MLPITQPLWGPVSSGQINLPFLGKFMDILKFSKLGFDNDSKYYHQAGFDRTTHMLPTSQVET
jgi:hypothetical protein